MSIGAIGVLLVNNIEYLALASAPAVIFLMMKVKNYRGNKNDLTQYMVRHNKQKEAMTKKSKSGSLFQ